MTQRIGTLSGVVLTPGVSANRRLYSGGADGNIRKAVKRMQERLADPNGKPITMLSHHGAGDDSTRIAARVTTVTIDPDDTVRWEADLADTAAGRDIAALTTPDQPYLANVSLRGYWVGPVTTTTVNGLSCETADDLEIDGIDFTKDPGVDAARINTANATVEAVNGLTRTYVTESLEETRVQITEQSTTEATSTSPDDGGSYADPGYQSDGKKRYPLTTKAQIRAAWACINMPRNATKYTAAQLKRIKGRIKTAAGKAGIDITAESAAMTAAVTEALEEAYASMCVNNGQGSVNVSGYTNDPAFLARMGKQVASAALAGLAALDPDNDGDIDLDPDATDGAPGGSGDETAPTTSSDASASGVNTKESSDMGDTTTATPESLTAMNAADRATVLLAMDPEERAGMLARLPQTQVSEFAAGLVTPGAPASETEPEASDAGSGDGEETSDSAGEDGDTSDTSQESLLAAVNALTEAVKNHAGGTTPAAESASAEPDIQQRIDTAVAAAEQRVRDELGRTLGRAGFRRGLVPTGENGAGKPLHEMTAEELTAYGAAQFEQVAPIVR